MVCCIFGDLLFGEVELDLSPRCCCLQQLHLNLGSYHLRSPEIFYAEVLVVSWIFTLSESEALLLLLEQESGVQLKTNNFFYLININFWPKIIRPTKCFSKTNLFSSLFQEEKGAKFLASYYKANFQILFRLQPFAFFSSNEGVPEMESLCTKCLLAETKNGGFSFLLNQGIYKLD